MCGRFTRKYTWKEVHDFLDVKWPAKTEQLPLSYNVAPTQPSAIARLDTSGKREIVIARWGLVPFWADDLSIGSRMINARAESVAGKPAFREPFRKRRCLVPVSGFFEWQKQAGSGGKQPWYIHPADEPIACFAGLWERWDKGEQPVETFTIITTEASEQIRELHDRMPVVLAPADFAAWLDPAAKSDDLTRLLVSSPNAPLSAHPVSTRVNSFKNNDASIIEPVSSAGKR